MAGAALRIVPDDLSGTDARALVALHLAGMHDYTPACHVHALGADALRQPGVTFWTAWRGTGLAGMAALRDLGDGTGEIKSMRTHPDHLRAGVAAALLDHLLAEARRRGYSRLSLETGSGRAFEPALTLYHRAGFAEGEAFGGYAASGFNRFFHLDLE